ncbi:MAG: Hpt domain-containing protein, partial [Synergistaceae bacterium]|nr:Hpt domain-containing protein [Synergistaceae bacterium]
TDETGGVVDRKLGLKNSAGDEALYLQVRANFLEDHASDAERIADVLRIENRAEARRLAHTLKGAAGLLGAAGLREAAFEVEKPLAEGDADPTADQMRKLRGELEAVLVELRRAAPGEPAPRKSDSGGAEPEGAFDREGAISLLDRLAPLLASGNTRSLELTDEIRRTLSPLGEKCEVLLKRMEEFDFCGASETLLSLRDSALLGKTD